MDLTQPLQTQIGRRPVKRRRILMELREQIVTGQLQPGSRLPSQIELQSMYETGTGTVQRALRTLEDEGFVRADGPRGTFVTDHPPHVAHYALLLPDERSMGSSSWSHFWAVIDRQLSKYTATPERQLKRYYGAGRGAGSTDYAKLLTDLEYHRLAGLVFVTPPFAFRGTPILNRTDIPRVGIMPPDPAIPDVPTVYPDFTDLLRQGVERVAERGKRHVAFLGTGRYPETVWQTAVEKMQQHGINTREHWIQHTSPYVADAIEGVVRLLLCDPSSRPDSLIVTDDNLVPELGKALEKLGFADPQRLYVVAHANLPSSSASTIPMDRLGFDTHAILSRCLDLLQEQRLSSDELPPATHEAFGAKFIRSAGYLA
ncbi:MAG: GntR family transcriptional regulator [Phycisphaera sp.]|nr:GntR family transcriptional regulator [Phycisphaera sp.]